MAFMNPITSQNIQINHLMIKRVKKNRNRHTYSKLCIFPPKMLYFQPEISSLLLAPPCHVHGEAILGGELQATVDAPVVPGRPLLAGPLHVDPLLLLGGHLQATVDAVPEGLLGRKY